MGWTIWTPNDSNIDLDIYEGKIKVKPLTDNKFTVKFLRDVNVELAYRKPFFDCCSSKYKSIERSMSISDTYWSSKNGTTRDNFIDSENTMVHSLQTSPGKASSKSINDDYQYIKDKEVNIKSIGVYSCHYIQGIKIKYESNNFGTFETFHRFPLFTPGSDPNINYREIELEESEFIQHIYWVKSMQTNFIRNITFVTNLNRNLWVEGEVEIYDILNSQNSWK